MLSEQLIRQFTALDGTVLSLRTTSSEPDTPVCLFIHGLADGAYVWDGVLSHIASLSGVLAVDLRGHGRSDWSASGTYSTEIYVSDILSVIDSLRLSRLILVGHSLGAAVAVHVAARRPENIVGLVLVDLNIDDHNDGAERVIQDVLDSLQSYESVDQYAESLLANRPLLTPQIARGLALGALRCVGGSYSLSVDPNVVKGSQIDATKRSRKMLEPVLRLISCPTVVIRGACSALLSAEDAKKTVSLLRIGRLITIPQAGHAVMSDNPAMFLQELISSISRLLRSI